MSADELVARCLDAGTHWRWTLRYVGEDIDRCQTCAAPAAWKPKARRLDAPTGQPVRMIEPTGLHLPTRPPARPMPFTEVAAAADRRWPQPCGTHAAAARHRRDGEKVCDACRAAEAEYARQRRARREVAA